MSHPTAHSPTNTGSAPSTAPSSVGRPGRGGGGGGAGVVGVGMGPGHLYRPYVAPHKIRRGFCLSLFVAINALTVLSALSVAVAEVLSVVYHRLSRTSVCVECVGWARFDGVHLGVLPPLDCGLSVYTHNANRPPPKTQNSASHRHPGVWRGAGAPRRLLRAGVDQVSAGLALFAVLALARGHLRLVSLLFDFWGGVV